MRTPLQTIEAIAAGKEKVSLQELLETADFHAHHVKNVNETLILELVRRIVILSDQVAEAHHIARECASYHSRC